MSENIASFIVQLKQLGIDLLVDGADLQISAPKGVVTADLKNALKYRKQEILDFFLNIEAGQNLAIRLVAKRKRPDRIPLLFAQRQMWLIDQIQPGNPAYNSAVGYMIDGALDEKALGDSFNEIIKRHEILRTTFAQKDGQAEQIIHPPFKIKVDSVNLSHLQPDEYESTLQKLAAEEAVKPFNLSQLPLIRVTLYKTAGNKYLLIINLHHIVTDGWSFDLLFKELAQLYRAFSTENPSPLEELPIQYADYVCWQRQWMQEMALEPQVAYWKKQLDGSTLVLELPTDKPRPPFQSYCGAKRYFTISKKLYEALKALSQREGCTLFMTIAAAFKTLLFRYTDQDDIIIGVPVAHRHHPELEKLIGLLINMVVLRTDMSGNPSFRTLLTRVREVGLEALAHQDLPFEKLVEALRPERDLSRNPLFQVLLELSPVENLELQLQGLAIEYFEFDSRTAQFDLSLHLFEGSQGIRGFLEYSTDLFVASTISRMIGHFQTLLEGIIADPEMRLSDLPLLTDAERQQILVDWNDTAVDFALDKCLHQLFEAQVERTPDAVALVTETENFTYRELNNRANQVAQHIISLGVGPDNIVGVFLERSAGMIAAILGIQKAGGAYMPLDPEYPKDRLAFMLSDSQTQLLVTQSQLKSQLPEKCPKLLCLDTDLDVAVPDSSENPQSTVQPNNLAYVLYTSGSTGIPKGVAIEHHSPVALISWAHEVFTEKEMGGVLFSTSICFDLSVFEIFSPLTTGGKVILADNLLELPSLKAASEVTLINTVPSAIAELVRIEGIPSSVCTVNLAGELLKSSLVQKIYDIKSIKRVYDLYGPSEDTTYSTWVLRTSDGPQTIGRPISNTQAHILDQQRQLIPIGVIGELYLGGAGLARGYLHRRDLTAEKFIKNPFDDGNSPRLYATGDLVRYLPDGNLVYMGRIDHQVKIRGFRIELGEIEAVISNHPAVKDLVVVANEFKPGDNLIIAYIVPKNKEISLAELRAHLATKLPNYMIPSNFIELEALPLTPNGKVDRKALPSPTGFRPDLDRAYVAPRTELEQAITTIWQEVLKIDKIGIEDNFFDLGGHSLRMARVLSKLRNKIQKDISIVVMFQYPTISSLAQYLSQAGASPGAYQPADERTEKLLEGKNRLKKRLKQHTQAK